MELFSNFVFEVFMASVYNAVDCCRLIPYPVALLNSLISFNILCGFPRIFYINSHSIYKQR